MSNYIQSRLFDLKIMVRVGAGVICSEYGKNEALLPSYRFYSVF